MPKMVYGVKFTKKEWLSFIERKDFLDVCKRWNIVHSIDNGKDEYILGILISASPSSTNVRKPVHEIEFLYDLEYLNIFKNPTLYQIYKE